MHVVNADAVTFLDAYCLQPDTGTINGKTVNATHWLLCMS